MLSKTALALRDIILNTRATLSAEWAVELGPWTKEVCSNSPLDVVENPPSEELDLLDIVPAAETHLKLLNEELVMDEVEDDVLRAIPVRKKKDQQPHFQQPQAVPLAEFDLKLPVISEAVLVTTAVRTTKGARKRKTTSNLTVPAKRARAKKTIAPPPKHSLSRLQVNFSNNPISFEDEDPRLTSRLSSEDSPTSNNNKEDVS